MATLPTRAPARLIAGDTHTWQISLPDYPASAGWVLAYRLINATGKIDITSTAVGDEHLVNVSAASSASWVAGRYTRQTYVTNGPERTTLATDTVDIDPNLAAQVAGYDSRSIASQLLDAVQAVLQKRAARSDLEYEIAGRRIKSMSHADLLAARDKLRREVAAETRAKRIAAGLDAGARVSVRF